MPRIAAAAREQMRGDLRNAARAVFRRGGLAAVTVRAVAAEAGCAAGALYTYYADKSALVRELALDSVAEMGRAVADAMADKDAAGRERLVAAAAARSVFGNGGEAAVLLPVLLDPDSGDKFQRRVTGRLIAALAPIAASLGRAGRTAAAANAETAAIAGFILGFLMLDSSGQLARLAVAPDDVVAAFAANRSGAV
ncbi:MAG: TetR family transcriptional regulator [Proteobacteria bacterium]|nr:TetR family transcriptional regulator [Pseudomonadota bacterium]MDA1132535.1 TetR family transcriptional regulator [Pseudomonadota bacterium]